MKVDKSFLVKRQMMPNVTYSQLDPALMIVLSSEETFVQF